jgi:hypothetical protein
MRRLCGGTIPHGRCLVAKPEEEYHTTLQTTSNWRARMVFMRPPSLRQRLLDYLVPTLWALALVVAGVAIFW